THNWPLDGRQGHSARSNISWPGVPISQLAKDDHTRFTAGLKEWVKTHLSAGKGSNLLPNASPSVLLGYILPRHTI
ncbi:MAG TPA: hypothetical protein VFA71_13655, partial [Terriglobales bacterium]|nr:hypothetical protein [Terriglobales bacterium]